YFSAGGEYTHGGLSVTATAYYNSLDNMIALVTLPNSQVPGDLYAQYMPLKTRKYQNLESAKTRGMDLTLRWRVSREWLVGAAYSYLDTDAQVYDTDHDIMQDVVIDGMAHHKGNWFATWNHRFTPAYQMGIGLYGRFSTKRYYQLNGNGKGNHTWRLSTTHDQGRSRRMAWRIEAGVDNILNYCDRTPHGLHLGTTTPGRTVYASLSVRFNQGKKLTNNYKSNLNYKQNDEQD
ncbi:MAG: TonB-dependent receptor, partial [Prevotella sp.]|nr:TonB-dependent receptor [Prevotella sp.]